MIQSSTKGERITAIVSTLVAVVILAAGVSARNASAPSVTPQDLTELESDLRFQLGVAFRHDAAEQKRRLAQLDAVVGAWKASPQTEEQRKLFAAWLKESTIRSLAGRIQAFPSPPEFQLAQEELSVELPVAEQESPLEKEPTAQLVANTAKQPALQLQQAETQVQAADQGIALGFDEPQLDAGEAMPGNTLEFDSRKSEANSATTLEQSRIAEPSSDEMVELPVVVNLVELAARIAGYHDALDKVELSLIKTKQPNLRILADHVETVRSLTKDYLFVSLYFESLSEGERRAILEPRSMNAMLAEIDRQLDLLESNSSDDFLKPFDRNFVEQMESLRGILADIHQRISD